MRLGVQVVLQSVYDLLTAQCDRHGENIFITASGHLTFIDNDRALGVVPRCGADSVLLPGSRWGVLGEGRGERGDGTALSDAMRCHAMQAEQLGSRGQ